MSSALHRAAHVRMQGCSIAAAAQGSFAPMRSPLTRAPLAASLRVARMHSAVAAAASSALVCVPPRPSSSLSSCPLSRSAASASTVTLRRSIHCSPAALALPSTPSNKEGDPSKLALTLAGVTKRFAGGSGGGRTLFSNLNLSFYHGAKIGILGANGCGKSSFLKIVGGIDKEIDGTSKCFPGFRVGYLSQEPELDASKTVAENIAEGIGYRQQLLARFDALSAAFGEEGADFDALTAEQAEVQTEIEQLNCWDLQYKVETAMEALRCPPGDSPVENLSGGERRRVALCRLLLSEPDILLLDEPTNHLDAESVSWLEQFLGSYSGLVMAITHDRYFLDKIAGWILEIDQGSLYPFKGNYNQWLESKGKRLDVRRKQSAALDKQIEKELAWVRAGVNGRQSKSKSRLKNFDNLMSEKRLRLQSRRQEGLNGALLIPEGPRLNESALVASDLSFSVSRSNDEDEKDPAKREVLFQGLSFKLNRGEMLGIIGPNGSGKTSLLRCLVGERELDSGHVRLSPSVVFGYNTQSREKLSEDKPLWAEIIGDAEEIPITAEYSMPARAYVAQFNFSGAEQSKLIRSLSGGERNRVSLAKSLRKGCNVIILDEPTNDLDVATLRALEEALGEFDGAGIIVSHDRWFLDRVCTHLLAFEPEGVRYFAGNYSEYEEMKKQEQKGIAKEKKKFKNIAIDT